MRGLREEIIELVRNWFGFACSVPFRARLVPRINGARKNEILFSLPNEIAFKTKRIFFSLFLRDTERNEKFHRAAESQSDPSRFH